jgi:SOS-response transcriptional repressor LexA
MCLYIVNKSICHANHKDICNNRIMEEYSERLTYAINLRGTNQSYVARSIGVKPQAIQYLCKQGKRSVHSAKIAEILSVNVKWLTEGIGEIEFLYKEGNNAISKKPATGLDNNLEEGPDNKGYVPEISWVQAGAWCEAIDNFEVGDAERWIPCPVAHSKHTYALRVKGDSMVSPSGNPISFPEGTLIYVDPESPLISGKKVIAKLLDRNEVTFKVYREDAGKKWLIPLNPMYDKIEFVEGMYICGVVIFAGFDV